MGFKTGIFRRPRRKLAESFKCMHCDRMTMFNQILKPATYITHLLGLAVYNTELNGTSFYTGGTGFSDLFI
jgi:hypothetical protein